MPKDEVLSKLTTNHEREAVGRRIPGLLNLVQVSKLGDDENGWVEMIEEASQEVATLRNQAEAIASETRKLMFSPLSYDEKLKFIKEH